MEVAWSRIKDTYVEKGEWDGNFLPERRSCLEVERGCLPRKKRLFGVKRRLLT
jgi:hypothetical protein